MQPWPLGSVLRGKEGQEEVLHPRPAQDPHQRRQTQPKGEKK